MKLPGPDHPITITPTVGRVTVTVGDRTIADSTSALDLAEADYPVVRYVPIGDVDQDVLRPSRTVTTCPYKGDASYFSIVTDEGELLDAAWSYQSPHAAVEPIAAHVAFYPDKVRISVATGA